MAWELGPLFLEAGRSARLAYGWSDGSYHGIQMVHAKPETWASGPFTVVGGPAEVAVTDYSVAFDPPTGRYTYTVDLTARRGDWYQYRLRGDRID